MASRRLSRSFERRVGSTPPYRQVHVNGRLLIEGRERDYTWQNGALLAFTYDLQAGDVIAVGANLHVPFVIDITNTVLRGTPIHLDGTIGLIAQVHEEVEGAVVLTQTEPLTIYEHLLLED
jgi:hypothetical protein